MSFCFSQTTTPSQITFLLQLVLTPGQKKTSRELAYAYKEDDGGNGHTENAETVTITLDVSQLTGEK